MGSTTPVLALPYPTPDDTVDVPRDVQALAAKLDGMSSLRPPLVSALPGSPVDGQEIYYLADAANGIIWHLRYRAASPNPTKWEYIGGQALSSAIGAGGATNSNTPQTSGQASLTVPLTGGYDFEIAARIRNEAAGANTMAATLFMGSTASFRLELVASGQFDGGHASLRRRAAPNAGTVMTLRYSSDSSLQSTFSELMIYATPVNVG